MKNPETIMIVWEEIPEKVEMFAIPFDSVSEEELHILEACHNNFINCTKLDTRRADPGTIDQSLQRLMALLTNVHESWIDDRYRDELKEYCNMSLDQFNAILGKWYQFKIDITDPAQLSSCRIYRSGFYV